MSVSHPTILQGQLANGELDFNWLFNNGDERLDASTAKIIIKTKNYKYIAPHGKLIRFTKRAGSTVVRIDLKDCTSNGIIASGQIAEKLAKMNNEELMAEKQSLSRSSKSKSTFAFVCGDYEKSEMTGLKPATIKGYKTSLNRLIQLFGNLALYELKHKHVEDWVINKLNSSKPGCKTIVHTLWMLEQVLSRSRVLGLRTLTVGTIDFKKLYKLVNRYKKSNRTVDDTKTLTLNDIKVLGSLSHQTLVKHNLHVIRDAAMLTATSVAGRSGEVRAIAVQDISKHGQSYKVNIQRTIVLEEFKNPKAFDASISEIDVFDISIPYLNRLINDAGKYSCTNVNVLLQNNEYECQTVNMLVVNPATGLPYTEKEYRSEFYRLQQFAGIQNPVPPKQLRHTAARLFKQAGIDITEFSKQLTHNNDKTTEDFYSGVIPRNNSKEVVTAINTKMNKVLSIGQKPPLTAKGNEGEISKRSRRVPKLLPIKTKPLNKLSPYDVGKVFRPLVQELNTI